MGSGEEYLDACLYASYYIKDLGLTTRLNFSEVSKRVAKGEGIYTLAENKSNGDGHIYVVSATQFIDGNNGIEHNIDYLDPKYGKSFHCSYDDFYYGNYNGFKVLGMIYTL